MEVYLSNIWENIPLSTCLKDIVILPSKQNLVVYHEYLIHSVYFVDGDYCFLLTFWENSKQGDVTFAEYSLFEDGVEIVFDSKISFSKDFTDIEYDDRWNEFCLAFVKILLQYFRVQVYSSIVYFSYILGRYEHLYTAKFSVKEFPYFLFS
jgi:hypothetical protein